MGSGLQVGVREESPFPRDSLGPGIRIGIKEEAESKVQGEVQEKPALLGLGVGELSGFQTGPCSPADPLQLVVGDSLEESMAWAWFWFWGCSVLPPVTCECVQMVAAHS